MTDVSEEEFLKATAHQVVELPVNASSEEREFYQQTEISDAFRVAEINAPSTTAREGISMLNIPGTLLQGLLFPTRALLNMVGPEERLRHGAAMKAKVSPAARLNFLDAELGRTEQSAIWPDGKPKVFERELQDGSRQVIINPTGKPEDWKYLDPPVLEPGDVAEVIPEIMQAGPGAVAGGAAAASGAGIVARGAVGAVGDAAGEGMTQLMAAGLPGDDEVTPGQRLSKVGTNVIAGLAGEALGTVGNRLITGVTAPITERGLVRSITTERLSKDLKRLAADRSIPGSKRRMIENLELALRNPGTLSAAEIAETEDGLGFLRLLIKERSSGASTLRAAQLENLYKNLERTFDKELAAMANFDRKGVEFSRMFKSMRRTMARDNSKLYEESMNQAHLLVGGQKVLPGIDAVEVFEREARRLRSLKPSKAVINQLDEMEKIIKKGGNLKIFSPIEMREFMRRASNWSVGKAPIDEVGSAQLRGIGARVSAALESELDRVVERGGLSGRAVGKIREAVEGYAFGNDRVRALNQTLMGKLKKAEAAGDAFNTRAVWSASEAQIATFKDWLKEANPELLEAYRGHAVKQMMDKTARPSTIGALEHRADIITPQTLKTFMGGHGGRLRALFDDSPKALKAIDDIQRIVELKTAHKNVAPLQDVKASTILDWVITKPAHRVVQGVGQIASKDVGALFRTPTDLADMWGQFGFIMQKDRAAQIMNSERGIRLLADVLSGADAARRAMMGEAGGRATAQFNDWNDKMQETISLAMEETPDFMEEFEKTR